MCPAVTPKVISIDGPFEWGLKILLEHFRLPIEYIPITAMFPTQTDDRTKRDGVAVDCLFFPGLDGSPSLPLIVTPK